jgi:hypothetical protein
MNGYFDVTLINNRGKKDGYFEQAIQDGYIMDALADLPVERKLPGNRNWINHNMAGMLMSDSLSGPAHANSTYNQVRVGMLSYIALTTTSSLPTYTDGHTWNQGGGGQVSIQTTSATPDIANTTSGAKRFIEDQVTAPTVWSDANREAIFFRNRFLWLPSQGSSNSIRSIAIHSNHQPNSTSTGAVGRVGRVRLRDSAGLPTTLNKTSSNSLLVEYTFALVSF